MEFLQQILGAAGADTMRAFTVVPSFGGYFRGVRGISFFSAEKITFSSCGSGITVCGEKLSVGKFFAGDLFISGNITGVHID